MAEKAELHIASKEKPILVAREPGFRKFIARGFVVLTEPTMVRISPFDESETVDLEEESGGKTTSVGYRAECQIVADWEAALKLRDLLSHHISEFEKANGPIKITRKAPTGRAKPGSSTG